MKVRWTRTALSHLRQLREYIRKSNPQAARVVAARIVEAVASLTQTPAIGRPGRVPGTRELMVPKTPYLVPYRLDQGCVEILAVLHARRKWPDRLRGESARLVRTSR
jgi:addiction module RelE/StbE family toxin